MRSTYPIGRTGLQNTTKQHVGSVGPSLRIQARPLTAAVSARTLRQACGRGFQGFGRLRELAEGVLLTPVISNWKCIASLLSSWASCCRRSCRVCQVLWKMPKPSANGRYHKFGGCAPSRTLGNANYPHSMPLTAALPRNSIQVLVPCARHLEARQVG